MDPEQDMIAALANKQPEARAYDPTWRDWMARGLLGLGHGRDFVQGLTGSSGLGSTGIGAVDLTPVGGVFGMQEAARQNEPGNLALNAVGTVAPFPAGRAALKAGLEAVKASPRLAATLGGLGGALMPGEAAAQNAPASPASPAAAPPAAPASPAAPQTLVPMPPQIDPTARGYRRPRNDNERSIHQTLLQQWQQAEAGARAEKAKQTGETERALALEGKRGEIAAAERKEAEEAQKKREGAPTELPPWALPAAFAASMAVPAGVRAYNQYGLNQLSKRLGKEAAGIRSNLRAGNLPEAGYAADTARELLKVKPSENKVPWQVQLAAGAIPLETAGFPMARDLLRPSDTDANREAWQNLKDPWYWLGRIAPQVASGASGATFGSHLPPPWPRTPDYSPEARGALKSLSSAKAAATKAKNKK